MDRYHNIWGLVQRRGYPYIFIVAMQHTGWRAIFFLAFPQCVTEDSICGMNVEKTNQQEKPQKTFRACFNVKTPVPIRHSTPDIHTHQAPILQNMKIDKAY